MRVPEAGGPPLPDDAQVTLSRASGTASAVHLYAAEAGEQHGALTWVRLRVRRPQLTTALVVSALVCGVLWTGWAFHERVATSRSGIAELLLLFPAAIATYASRQAPHRLTDRLLRASRGVLLVVSILPYVAAGALALQRRTGSGDSAKLTSDAFATWWVTCAAVATACVVALFLARALPQPTLRRQRWWAAVGLTATPRASLARAGRALLAEARSSLRRPGRRRETQVPTQDPRPRPPQAR